MLKSDLLKYFGKRVEKLRAEKNLSQIDLAAKMEGSIDITNISRIENGRTNPTLFTLYRLSQAFEITISELLDFEYREEKKTNSFLVKASPPWEIVIPEYIPR